MRSPLHGLPRFAIKCRTSARASHIGPLCLLHSARTLPLCPTSSTTVVAGLPDIPANYSHTALVLAPCRTAKVCKGTCERVLDSHYPWRRTCSWTAGQPLSACPPFRPIFISKTGRSCEGANSPAVLHTTGSLARRCGARCVFKPHPGPAVSWALYDEHATFKPGLAQTVPDQLFPQVRL